MNPLKRAVQKEQERQQSYEAELDEQKRISGERSNWDYYFFDLSLALLHLVKCSEVDREQLEAEIADLCFKIADFIKAENSLPTVERFESVYSTTVNAFDRTDGTVRDCQKTLGRADLPGICVVLDLFRYAIRADNAELNSCISVVSPMANACPFMAFRTQIELQGDLRGNVREQDFTDILTGRTTAEKPIQNVRLWAECDGLIDSLKDMARVIEAHPIDSATVRLHAEDLRRQLVASHNLVRGRDKKLFAELGQFAGDILQVELGSRRTKHVPSNVCESLRAFASKLGGVPFGKSIDVSDTVVAPHPDEISRIVVDLQGKVLGTATVCRANLVGSRFSGVNSMLLYSNAEFGWLLHAVEQFGPQLCTKLVRLTDLEAYELVLELEGVTSDLLETAAKKIAAAESRTEADCDDQKPTQQPTAAEVESNLADIEAETPELDTESGDWIAARKENQENFGVLISSLKKYRLKAEGGRKLNEYFGVDRDGRKWRRKGTPASTVYYLKSSLPKSGD